jgi:hypothetical protein
MDASNIEGVSVVAHPQKSSMNHEPGKQKRMKTMSIPTMQRFPKRPAFFNQACTEEPANNKCGVTM